MKNFLLLFFLTIPLLFFGQKSEGLSFESTIYDFGNLSSNSEAVATFLFSNEAGTPIEIVKIHGGNHCIDIDSSSIKMYAPNEKGIITVIYDTDCKGPIRKTLSVFTSLKDSNTISLKLTGKISD